MKNKIFLLIIILKFSNLEILKSYAQAPNKFSYQAVIRNASDALVINQNVGMRISILQTSATGTPVYVETQTASTNANGLVNIQIGNGTVVSGNFTTINWASSSYFIKTQTDPAGGANYTITSTTQLLSVPYALYATTSGSSIPGPQGPQGIQGLTGATGAQGVAGTNGTNGKTVLNGTVAPTLGIGATGDFYINTNTSELFGPKTVGSWGSPISLVGPTGLQGPAGTNGTNGIDGINGTNGIDGINGTNGADGATGPVGPPGNSNTLDEAYNQGGFGAGRIINADYGAVEIDGADGFVSTGTFGSGTIPLTGAGTRMMWYPAKSAFRAGAVDLDQWDDINIGNYSFASGKGTKASGLYSTAMGVNATASGYGSTAIGILTTASGDQSTALGIYASTNNHVGSFVFGDYSAGYITNNSADNQFMVKAAGGFVFYNDPLWAPAKTMVYNNGNLGVGTTTPLERLEVAGNVSSSGNLAGCRFADRTQGYNNGWQWYSSGGYARLYDHANSADRIVIGNAGKVGIGTSTPEFKLSLDNDGGIMAKGIDGSGATLTTSGAGTRMMWYPRNGAFRAGVVSGSNWDNVNIGLYSFASGYDTKASGAISTAMGVTAIASGYASVALGDETSATGDESVAIGYLTTASALASLATGYTTTASGIASTAMGYVTTANALRSTAMGSFVSTNGHPGSFIYGDKVNSTVTNCTADNQFMVRATGGTIFYSSAFGAGVSLAAGGGAWTNLSDKNKKENFTKINNEEILHKLSTLPITNWNYKSQDKQVRHIGPMAQDFYAAFKLDGQSDTTINTLDIDGVNMAAIQALTQRTDELKLAIEELKKDRQLILVLSNELNSLKASLEKSGSIKTGKAAMALTKK